MKLECLLNHSCKTVEVFYDVIEMYSTKSQRELKKTFKDLRDQQTKQQEALHKHNNNLTNKIKAQAQLAQVAEQFQANQAREDYQNELDRINKKKWQLLMRHLEMKMLLQIMTIMVVDALEITNLALQENRAKQDYQTKLSDIHSKKQNSSL
jgi:hypothetical protein